MTSPVVMPAGHKIVATDLDAYENLTGAWTSFNPTWTATGVAPSLGNGTSSGNYIQVGKLVIYRARFDFGTTTTFGTGSWNFTIPVPFGGTSAIGSVYLADFTGIHYPGVCAMFSTVLFLVAVGGDVTATVPFTWATSDNLLWTVVYEAA